MKIRKALLALACVFAMASYCAADTIPPDGNVGVKGGSASTEITTTSFSFILTNCTLFPSSDDCTQANAAFGAFPQGAFAGDNDSGVPIRQLNLTLNFAPLASPESFGCDGGTLFSRNDCPTLLPAGTSSVTFNFFQGTGTGIGCFDSTDEGDSGPNAACIRNLGGDSPLSLGSGGPEDICNVDHCGPSPHFVVAVGFGSGPWPPTSIPTDGTGHFATPEPGTIALVLTGLAGLVERRRRRKS